MDIDATYSDVNDSDLSPALRLQIKRVAKCLSVLNEHHHPISDATIASLVRISTAYVGEVLQSAENEQAGWKKMQG